MRVEQSGLGKYLALFVTYSVITTIAIGARLWIRGRLTKSLAHDDWMLVLAQIANLFLFGLNSYVCVLDLTSYIDDATFARLPEYFFYVAVSYSVAVFWQKASMGVFFYRLTQATWQKVLICGPLIIFQVYNVGTLLILIFRCGFPVHPAASIMKDDCQVSGTVVHAVGSAFSVMNAALDWNFAIVPIFLVIRAKKLDPGSRGAVWFLIALAMVGSIVAMVRVIYIYRSSVGKAARTDGIGLNIVSATELAIGTIALSLATMRPLLGFLGFSLRKLQTRPSQVTEMQEDRPSEVSDAAGAEGSAAATKRKKGAFPGIGIFSELSLMSRDEDESTLTVLGRTLNSVSSRGKAGARPTMRRTASANREGSGKGLLSINEVAVEDV